MAEKTTIALSRATYDKLTLLRKEKGPRSYESFDSLLRRMIRDFSNGHDGSSEKKMGGDGLT